MAEEEGEAAVRLTVLNGEELKDMRFLGKVIGSAVLPLCQIQFTDEVFTLQVWRPSGRAKGLLKVACRIEYNDGLNLGFYSNSSSESAGVEVNSSQRESTQGFSYSDHGYCTSSSGSNVIPSAPPMPDDYSSSSSGSSSVSVLMPSPDSWPPMPDNDDPLIVKNDDPDIDKNEQLIPSDVAVDSSIKSNVMAGVLVGVLGGAVAVATLLIRAKANT
ncbi:hypothetical protein C5167_033864 [Papaver somniferum]|uniref:C2 domain-containing protein n=1 Tax=Papaver somniferum TaxID=3469 RepID=A0A4Y7KCY4_PAPSO|nr:uncharacterized protein LOC113293100 [Papaver somniferum]RZC70696.1 hypothetical protein C5167_033864 [Papaver somniferum]